MKTLLDDVTDVPESGEEFNDDLPDDNPRDLGDVDEDVGEEEDDLGNDDIERSAMLIARALSSLKLWFSFSSCSAVNVFAAYLNWAARG